MPKMKTKSAAKKRFSMTASGKVKTGPAGKRHGMIKRTTKQIRNLRGTTTLFGPVVGAGLVLLLQDRLTTSNLPVGIVTGLVFILVVLFFRRGVVGTVQHWLRRK